LRRLHKGELYDLYSSPYIIRAIRSGRIRWAGHVAGKGTGKVHTGFWWGRPVGKRLLERPRCRWKDNIKMGLQEVEWEGMDWIDLAQDRDRWQALVNVVMNLRVL
jgi:hypothetical protein